MEIIIDKDIRIIDDVREYKLGEKELDAYEDLAFIAFLFAVKVPDGAVMPDIFEDLTDCMRFISYTALEDIRERTQKAMPGAVKNKELFANFIKTIDNEMNRRKQNELWDLF